MNPVLLAGRAWHTSVHAAEVGLLALVVVVGGRWLVSRLLRHVDGTTAAPLDEGAVALPGGAWVGMLERLAIYWALVTHHPEMIAVCLAVKGLARYPELKAPNPGAAELFIIGTFASVLVACGGAGLALWLVGLW